MPSKLLYQIIETDKTLDEVSAALKNNAMTLGVEAVQLSNNSIRIVNGKEGVQFGFAADFDATITVNQKPENRYEVLSNITWKMNTLSWICLIVGLFVFGILWVIPLLFLFIDPSKAYNNYVFMAGSNLGAKVSPFLV